MTTDTDNQTLYLVDASGFIFRAYYAMAYRGPQLTNPNGVPVGAVLGFVNMMLKLLKDLDAKHVGVIFDAARANFRNDIYPEYKANRDETPEDLIPQFPLIRDATRAFGFEPLEMPGFEADDLIAAYAKEAHAKNVDVVIVSSDKDLMQLVRDGVAIYDPAKDKKIGPDEVLEKFGVTPDKVVDVQSLCGDSTDNVPGVRGIGPKTAAELINTYGSLEGLLENVADIKQPKRRESLIAEADMARVSRQLVLLDENAPLPKPIDALGDGDLGSDVLIAFLEEHGFQSVVKRINTSNQNKSSAPMQSVPKNAQEEDALPLPGIKGTYTTITDVETLNIWMDEARKTGLLAIDTETTSLTPAKADLCGISITSVAGKAAYIPVGHRAPAQDLLSEDTGKDIVQMDADTALKTLAPVLCDPAVLKIGQNIKYDLQMLVGSGVTIAPYDDTMLLSYVLDGTAHSNAMDELAKLHLNYQPTPYSEVAGKGAKQISFAEVDIESATAYAAEDADITLRLYQTLKPRLAVQHMATVYETMDRPLAQVIAKMEARGIKVDVRVLSDLSSLFTKKIAELETEIFELASTTFNVASPKQLGEVLFDQMGLPGSKKTKTGVWSTAVDVLDDLAEEGYEIVDKVLEHRQMSKLRSTYTDALQQQINPRTGRVHTSFSLAAVSTGRLASSDPNLQNIPIRSEEGRKIREAFIAEEGYTLLAVDYSQIELRLAAALADIPALKDAFSRGDDIHALTASEVFGIPMAEMTADIRRNAKAINFGIIYGISGWGLAKQLGCPPAEANDYIRQYMERFPELRTYMETKKQEARDKGHVKTLFGRTCVIQGIFDKARGRRAGAERQAINAPLQGTAADIMKRAMIKIDQALKTSDLDCTMLLQVHDELIFEVREDQAEEAAAMIKDIMENVADVGVPLIAEAGIAKNWSAAH